MKNFRFLGCLLHLIFAFLTGFSHDTVLQNALYHPDHLTKCKNLFALGVRYIDYKNDSLEWAGRELLNVATEAGNSDYQVSGYNLIGLAKKEVLSLDSAGYYFYKALELSRSTGNEIKEMKILLNFGHLYFRQNLIDKSLLTYESGIEIAKLKKDTVHIIKFLINIGLALKQSMQIDSSYTVQKQALHLIQSQESHPSLFDVLLNLSGLCHQKKEFIEGLKYAEQAHQLAIQANNNKLIFLSSINRIINLTGLNKHAEAEIILNEIKSLPNIKDDPEYLKLYYGNKIVNILALGKYAELKDLVETYNSLKDTLHSKMYNEKLAELETKYQVKEKESQILVQQNKLVKQRGYLILVASFFLFSGIIGWLYVHRTRLRQKSILDAAIIHEQKLGLDAVIKAQEEERKRIARDLHDGIAQEMVAIKFGFQQLTPEIQSKAPEMLAKITQLDRQIDETCTEVRNLSHVMLPPTLENNGLIAALQQLLKQTLESRQIQTEFEVLQFTKPLAKEKELAIYRIIQELINNILKHAKASRVMMQMYQTGDQLIVQLEDNGVGYDFNDKISKGSLGLLNILSRVKNLGAHFHSSLGENGGVISTLRVSL